MDAFCEQEGVSVEELFEQISAVNDDPMVTEFLPTVLRNVEYSHFARQMKEVAENDDYTNKAMDSSVTATSTIACSVNISGKYTANNADFDNKSFKEFVTVMGCPWVLRSLITRTVENIQNLLIIQNEDMMTVKFKMKFFGSKSNEYFFDGRPRMKKNLFGIEARQVARVDYEENAVVVQVVDHPLLGPGGYTEHKFVIENMNGEENIHWKISLNDPSKDRYISTSLYFLRENGDLNSRK